MYRGEPFENPDEFKLKVSHPVTKIKSDTVENQKSDKYESIFDSIKNVLNKKNSQYSTDPISVLSIDDLLCQIKIKAVRAQLANFKEKREDELLDIIVYSILTLKKVEENNRGL